MCTAKMVSMGVGCKSLKQGGGIIEPETGGGWFGVTYIPLKLDTEYNSSGIKGLKSKDSFQ